MKALCKQTMGFILMILLACGVTSIKAQDSADDEFITVSGVVKDKQTRKKLEYVNISIPGTNVGTITNNDGEFSIKVKNGLHARQVEVSHIGYLNGLIPVNDKDILECTVLLEPNMNTLSEVIIRAGDPRYIVEEAIEKVNKNYITTGSMLTGFYRETAQKGRRYINISEAVIDVYKTPYKDRNVERDRVQIYKGRKLLSEKASDTLAVKLLGKLQVLFNGSAMQAFNVKDVRKARLYTGKMTGNEQCILLKTDYNTHYEHQALNIVGEVDIRLSDFHKGEEEMMLVGVPENHQCDFFEHDAVYIKYEEGKREDAEAAVRRVLRRFDVPEEKIMLSSLDEYISGNYKEETYYANLLSALTVFSVLITFSGVFSMLLYSLRLRRR